ncbi:MAG: hypothetical protein K2L71_05220 [Muribaculaceae bacterium]|nr:hypothetical protein [Muribaculaceae bacterium]
MIEFEESGLTFRLDEDNCFRVEQHPLANRGYKTSTHNIKACEFISYINGRHIFVEAKSSAPRKRNGSVDDLTLNGNPMPDNWTAYDNYTTFLRDITKKFVDSYSILKAIREGLHGQDAKDGLHLPDKTVSNSQIEFVLILNIRDNAGNVVRDSFANLKEALTNEMRPFLNVWKISSNAVKVCWPGAARHYGFLTELND